MSINTQQLEKKAIKAALEEDWNTAIELNTRLLEVSSKNIKAKIRLGRAYLQTKQFSEAAKLFEQVLAIDPINQIAKKNYELAKEKKTETSKKSNGKSLIIEPGTTKVVKINIEKKDVTANSFTYGEPLALSTTKSKVTIKQGKTNLGEVNDTSAVKSILQAEKKGSKLSAAFLKGTDNQMLVLIKSSEPVFKGEQQDVKPYMKKGSIDEPELIIESFDDE